MHVLVVDDEPIIALVLREVLIDEGYEVDIARSGTEALNLLRVIPVPDVILLDLALPDISGRTFVECLRGNPTYNNVAVILISAYAGDENVFPDRAMYQALISKPFDVEDVVRQVQRFEPAK